MNQENALRKVERLESVDNVCGQELFSWLDCELDLIETLESGTIIRLTEPDGTLVCIGSLIENPKKISDDPINFEFYFKGLR